MIKAGLKQKLNNGEVVFGTFVKLNSPSLVEMFGYTGLDFVIFDNEHSNFSHPDMENMIRAADGVDLYSIIRVPSGSEEQILHSLDSGATGVQIPSLTTVADVRKAMPFTKYYPLGRRGMNMSQRACNFGFMNKDEYFKAANENTLVVVHVENKEMVEQIEELCQVPEIDVLFAGPGDLSQSVGKPMQVNDPEVVALVERIFTTAAKYNKKVGIWVGNMEAAEKYINMGAQYIAFQNDISFISSAIRDLGKNFDKFRNK